MFNFSKKKSELPPSPQTAPQAPPAPNNNNGMNKTNQLQSYTKVEDEMASFEIPDFTEDDLNFDLGINEFTPNPAQNQQTMPQTQPSVQQSAPQSYVSSPNPVSIPAPEPQVPQEDSEPPLFEVPPAVQPPVQPAQESFQHSRRFEQPQDFPSAPELDLDEGEEVSELPEKFGDADEEIPKFDVAPINKKGFGLESSRKDLRFAQEPRRDVKREISSLLQDQAEKDMREQRRGIFMPNTIYEKVVILTEDTVKQANYGEGSKTKFSSLMESKRQQTEELSKISRSVIDLLLDCDARLFEKVVQDGQ